jgi:hypothetical protein
MSDATFSLDQRKTLAEIDQLYANTHKLLLEATKMDAETGKLRTDARLAGWQVAFAGFTAGALVIGAIVTAMKVLGG